jgi:transcription termination/antitermination protein NusA
MFSLYRLLRTNKTVQQCDPPSQSDLGGREAELNAKRMMLGVEDGLKDIPGVTVGMLVAFGENGIKTIADLAGCATDDLHGWDDRKGGRMVHHTGVLNGFKLSREACGAIIMRARVKAGWVDAADLPAQPSQPMRSGQREAHR